MLTRKYCNHDFSQSQSQYSLFSLGMFTYTYELKRLPRGGGERRKKKGLSDLALPLHVII
jgi:hypothetical protein